MPQGEAAIRGRFSSRQGVPLRERPWGTQVAAISSPDGVAVLNDSVRVFCHEGRPRSQQELPSSGGHALEAAITLARAVAAVHGKPAWLLDETGYPLKPIEPRIH